MTEFELIIDDISETLIIDGNSIKLKPLQLANTFLQLHKEQPHSSDKQFITTFHSKFYDIDVHLSYAESSFKKIALDHSFNFTSDKPLDLDTPMIKGITTEAEILHYAIRIWLNYHPGSTPSERFCAISDSMELTNLSQIKALIKLFTRKEYSKNFIFNRLRDAHAVYLERSKQATGYLIGIARKVQYHYTSKGSLLSLMWKEIEYYIQHNIYAKQCMRCCDWFTVKSGVGYKSVQQMFCNDTCRKAFNKPYQQLYNAINKSISREKEPYKKIQLMKLREQLKNTKKSDFNMIGDIKAKYKEYISRKKGDD